MSFAIAALLEASPLKFIMQYKTCDRKYIEQKEKNGAQATRKNLQQNSAKKQRRQFKHRPVAAAGCRLLHSGPRSRPQTGERPI